MSKPTLTISILTALLALCIYLLASSPKTSATKEITLYCAAGFRKPITEVITNFENETGYKVNVIYNGSGALLTQIQLSKGDLYLPANEHYVTISKNKNLTSESIPTTSLTAVIVTQKSNTSINTIHDLTKSGIKISFADQTSAIGKYTHTILAQHKLLEGIKQNITVTKPTVTSILEDVSLNTVDATIAWESVAKSYPNTKTISSPLFTKQPTSIAILKSSKNPDIALHFAKYLTSPEKGIATLLKHGFNQ